MIHREFFRVHLYNLRSMYFGNNAAYELNNVPLLSQNHPGVPRDKRPTLLSTQKRSCGFGKFSLEFIRGTVAGPQRRQSRALNVSVRIRSVCLRSTPTPRTHESCYLTPLHGSVGTALERDYFMTGSSTLTISSLRSAFSSCAHGLNARSPRSQYPHPTVVLFLCTRSKRPTAQEALEFGIVDGILEKRPNLTGNEGSS